MKILILVIVIKWSFGGGYQDTPSYKIVSSIENAAIAMYLDKKSNQGELGYPQAGVDQKTYTLYEIDLTAGVIKTIPIPKVSFSEEG